MAENFQKMVGNEGLGNRLLSVRHAKQNAETIFISKAFGQNGNGVEMIVQICPFVVPSCFFYSWKSDRVNP